MSSHAELRSPRADPKLLLKSALFALVLEFCILTGVGTYDHWLSHPQPVGLNTSNFIEAEVVQIPKEGHLRSEKNVSSPHPQESVLSKVPGKGKKAKPEEKPIQEENQTQAGSSLGPTHGPVAIYAPQPVIPSYLRNQEIKANVVIDFYVSAQGAVSPRLAGSSGNEELDAVALGAAKKWQFRPAEKDHHPVDSKVRLRILFEVK